MKRPKGPIATIFLFVAMLLCICSVVYALPYEEEVTIRAIKMTFGDEFQGEYTLKDKGENFQAQTKDSVFNSNVEISIPKKSSGYVRLAIPEIDVNIGIGLASENTNNAISNKNMIIYAEPKESFSFAVLPIEGQAKQITVINSKDAPDKYFYSIDLPKGAHLKHAVNPYNTEILTGSVDLHDAKGNRIGSIDAPKVVDSEGVELISSFDINDTSLIQNIDLQDAVFPVVSSFNIAPYNYIVARSADIFTYFESPTVLWNRDGPGLHSLSLGGRTWDENTRYLHETPAWNAVKSYYEPISAIWYNESGLSNQYYCHSSIAQRKDPWNLEPWRPDPGYFQTVLALCNP